MKDAVHIDYWKDWVIPEQGFAVNLPTDRR